MVKAEVVENSVWACSGRGERGRRGEGGAVRRGGAEAPFYSVGGGAGGGGSGRVVPSLRPFLPFMRGKLMRGRGSGKDGVRFGEERGGWGSGRAWWHIGAQAPGGGGGMLEEGEGEGAGVGRAAREAEAQEYWGKKAGHRPKPRRLGQKHELGPIQKIKPFLILFEI
jgi:hypothetical protein